MFYMFSNLHGHLSQPNMLNAPSELGWGRRTINRIENASPTTKLERKFANNRLFGVRNSNYIFDGQLCGAIDRTGQNDDENQ